MKGENQDIQDFEELVANCYSIFIGTERTIKIAKQAFEANNIKLSPNNIFYKVKSTRKTENKLGLVTDLNLKIKILKHLHIL